MQQLLAYRHRPFRQLTLHPAARVKLSADFDLPIGYTLSGSPTVTDDSDGDLVIESVALSADRRRVEFFVSGGTSGMNHIVTAQALAIDGQSLVAEGVILVRGAAL